MTVYRQNEYAILIAEGELVKILGSLRAKSKFGIEKDYLTFVRLSDIDPLSGVKSNTSKCLPKEVAKINNEELQFALKMLFDNRKFEIIRQI